MLQGQDGGGGSWDLKVEGEALVKYVSAILDVTSGQTHYRQALTTTLFQKYCAVLCHQASF